VSSCCWHSAALTHKRTAVLHNVICIMSASAMAAPAVAARLGAKIAPEALRKQQHTEYQLPLVYAWAPDMGA
jgi:hypothetical protein